MRAALAPADREDFSLVLGGPLYQLFRRAHLSGNALQLLTRRVLVLVGIAWLPLLALSALDGHAWDGDVQVPFLLDIDAHVRLLVALPLILVAELVVYLRMRPVVHEFRERGLIPDDARGEFDAAIDSSLRLRNSITAEIALLALVYGLGVFVLWRKHGALGVSTWYGTHGDDGALIPTRAGWWLGCVSLPIVQFLLIRWYWRMFVWGRLLWKLSRIDLRLTSTHPDGVGGLGFLEQVSHAFAPLLVAQGALLAGLMADRIVFMHAVLTDFKVEVVAVAAVMVAVVVGPLLVFGPQLQRVKRAGLREYGALAQRYAREFDEKWLRGAPTESPLGSADIQSLADLGNAFTLIERMKSTPFSLRTVLRLVIITLVPVAPLTLTMIPLDELVRSLLKLVF